jgi:hypothetical protein
MIAAFTNQVSGEPGPAHRPQRAPAAAKPPPLTK